MMLDFERMDHRIDDALSNAADVADRVDAGEQHDKFVAAFATDGVNLPQRCLQSLHDIDQQFVADAVGPGCR